MSSIGGMVDDGRGPLLDAAGNRLKRADMTEEEKQEDNRRRKNRARLKTEKTAAAAAAVGGGMPPPVRPIRASRPMTERFEIAPPLDADGAGFLLDEMGVRIPRAEMTPEQKREDNKKRKLRERLKQQHLAAAAEDGGLEGALLGEGLEESEQILLEDDGAGFLRDEGGQRIPRAEMTPEQRHEDNKRRKLRARMKQQAEEGELGSGLLTPDERMVAELLKDVPAGQLEPDDLELLKRYNMEQKGQAAKTTVGKGAIRPMSGKGMIGKGAPGAGSAASRSGKGATGTWNAASISRKGAPVVGQAASASSGKGTKRAWSPAVPISGKGAVGKGKALAGGKGYNQLLQLLSSMGGY